MAANQMHILPGYPTKWGNKEVTLDDRSGPNPYAPGTGQVIRASDYGMGGFDKVEPIGLSLSGTYFFRVLYPANPNPSSTPGAVSSVAILWYVLATGLEAAAIDLSGEIARLAITGV